jgi:hypothetical protein
MFHGSLDIRISRIVSPPEFKEKLRGMTSLSQQQQQARYKDERKSMALAPKSLPTWLYAPGYRVLYLPKLTILRVSGNTAFIVYGSDENWVEAGTNLSEIARLFNLDTQV